LEADRAENIPGFFNVTENLFTAVFFIEVVIHFLAEGCRVYFSDRMNWLDAFLVAMSVVDAWISSCEKGQQLREGPAVTTDKSTNLLCWRRPVFESLGDRWRACMPGTLPRG
jgi:hypothetical protein